MSPPSISRFQADVVDWNELTSKRIGQWRRVRNIVEVKDLPEEYLDEWVPYAVLIGKRYYIVPKNVYKEFRIHGINISLPFKISFEKTFADAYRMGFEQ